MNQIPTAHEYLDMLEQCLPQASDDWTVDERLLNLQSYIYAATVNLACHVSLYQEKSGEVISSLVIKQFLEHIEMLAEEKK